MYKKMLIFAAVGIVAVGLFSGCNNNTDSSKNVSTAKTESSVRVDESRIEVSKRVSTASDLSDSSTMRMIELPIDDEDDESEISDSSDKGFSEDELKKMSELDAKIQELIKSDEFESASLDERHIMAESFLNNCESEGLVKKGSIIAGDDSVSFQYESGVLGGISIKDFDPYMN